MASRPDIEERLGPLVDGVEDFITSHFLIKESVSITKKSCGSLAPRKNCRRKRRGREYSGTAGRDDMIDLMQSLEMGQEVVPVDRAAKRRAVWNCILQAGIRDRKSVRWKGTTPFIKVCWLDGGRMNRFQRREDRQKRPRRATRPGLLMESDAADDEANRDTVGEPWSPEETF